MKEKSKIPTLRIKFNIKERRERITKNSILLSPCAKNTFQEKAARLNKRWGNELFPYDRLKHKRTDVCRGIATIDGANYRGVGRVSGREGKRP